MPRRTRRTPSRRVFLLGVSIASLATAAAAAESALVLPYPPPESFGVVPAATYDEDGKRVGDATLGLELEPDERVALHLRGGFEAGARIALDAELAPIEVDGQRALRIVHERSQSHDPGGKPLVILEIDHEKGEASCTPPEGERGKRSTLELPSPDRVVNVPLNLLFRPLVLGTLDHVSTQAFFCLGGARVMGFEGTVVPGSEGGTDDGRRIREVRYHPDGKGLLSWAARPFAPRISFWMDAAANGAYVALRMPLYSRGPVVYIIANGIDPARVFEP